jgi:tetratricopeptide (TPR) repeat protein
MRAQDPERLRIFDVFVVKYNSEQQSYLSVHRDSSLISVTVALNEEREYEGGGMWIEPLDHVVHLDKGHAVTFASNIRHGGHRVRAGLRYILVGFLLYEGYVEHDRRLLEASQHLRAQGKQQDAIALCEKVLDVNPRRQEAWNNLGVLQRDAGRYAEATRSLRAALDIDDKYVEGWTNLGVCQGMYTCDELPPCACFSNAGQRLVDTRSADSSLLPCCCLSCRPAQL